jgi:hypothetical protein
MEWNGMEWNDSDPIKNSGIFYWILLLFLRASVQSVLSACG